MKWHIVYTKQAQKDAKKLASSGLIQHRLVYKVLEIEKTLKILRMWTYYE